MILVRGGGIKGENESRISFLIANAKFQAKMRPESCLKIQNRSQNIYKILPFL